MAALRVLIPNADIRKVGEAREWTRKSGARAGEVVKETAINFEDATGEPLVASIDHTKLDLPVRGDNVTLEVDLSTYTQKDSFNVQTTLTVVNWAHTEA